MSSNPDRYTEKLNQWGLILSVFTYGVHFALFVPLLLRMSKLTRAKLSTYIVMLFALATAGIGLQIWWTQIAFIENQGYPGGPNRFMEDHLESPQNQAVTAVYLVLNWFADGLLLYRSYVLHGALGGHRRIALAFSVCSFIALIVTASVFFNSIAGLGLNLWSDMSTVAGIAYLVLSLSLNTVLTISIVWRILWIRHSLRRSLGPKHGREYTSLVALLIESAALYTIVALVAVIACGLNSPIQYALLPVLGQLQAIPPLLILRRVVQRRALTEETCPTLHFLPSDPINTKEFSPLHRPKTHSQTLFIKCTVDVTSDAVESPLSASSTYKDPEIGLSEDSASPLSEWDMSDLHTMRMNGYT